MKRINSFIVLTFCTFSVFSQSFEIKEFVNHNEESYFTIYSIKDKRLTDSIVIAGNLQGGIMDFQSFHVSAKELLVSFESNSNPGYGRTISMMRLKLYDNEINVESEFNISMLYHPLRHMKFILKDNELHLSKEGELIKCYSLSEYYDLKILADELLR